MAKKNAERTARGELRSVKLADLVADPRNPKVHDEINRLAVRESLAKHRQVAPPIVQEGSNRIIAGNLTVEEMVGLGFVDADVYVIECSDEEATELSVTLNRTGELGEWDRGTLREIFGELAGRGDGKIVGWSQDELAKILGQATAPSEFPAVDESIETQYCCPRCSYRWSGKTGSAPE